MLPFLKKTRDLEKTAAMLPKLAKGTEELEEAVAAGASVGGGVAAGGGVEAFFVGLAAGLKALGAAVLNPAGAIGLAVVAGLIITLAGAMFIAQDAIRSFEKGFEKVMDSIVEAFKAFISLDLKHMFALPAVLLALGAAFPVFAVGFAVGMNLMSLAVPGIIELAAAIWLLSKTGIAEGETSAIASLVNGITKAFDVDPDQVERAGKAMFSTAKLFAGLALVTAEVTAIGMAAVARKFVEILSGIDIIGAAVDSAHDMKTAINAVALLFGSGIDAASLKTASKNIKPIVKLLAGIADVTKHLREAGSLNTYAGGDKDFIQMRGVWKAITIVFTGDEIYKFLNSADAIKMAVDAVGKKFSNLDTSALAPDGLAVKNITNIAGFTASLAGIVDNIKKAGDLNTTVGSDPNDPLGAMLAKGVMKSLELLVQGDDVINFADAIAGIWHATNILIGAFGNAQANQAIEAGTASTLKGITDMTTLMGASIPLFDTANQVMAQTKKLKGFNVVPVVLGALKSAQTDILNSVSSWVKVGDDVMVRIDSTTHLFESLTKLFTAATDLATAVNSFNLDNFDKAMSQVFTALPVVITSLTPATMPAVMTPGQIQQSLTIAGTVTTDDETTHALLQEVIDNLKGDRSSNQGHAPDPRMKVAQ